MKCMHSFSIIYIICQLVVTWQRSPVDACGQVAKLQYRLCPHHISHATMTSRKKWNAVAMSILNYRDHDNRNLFILHRTISVSISLHQRYLSRSSNRILLLRGGSSSSISTGSSPSFVSSKENDQIILLNPSFQKSYPSSEMTLGDLESSYASVQNSNNYDGSNQQQQQQQQQQDRRRRKSKSNLQPILAHASTFIVAMQALYQQYPLFTQITLACILFFIAWHIPMQSLQNIMSQYFICRRSHLTIRNGQFLSLLLSALSHISLTHLAYNLMALLSLGPTVQSILEQKFATKGIFPRSYQHLSVFSSVNASLWLLVIGAAMSGSIAYLVWNEVRGIGSSAAGCLGLSTVTMSLLSIYASAYPDKILQTRLLGVIPIRMPANRMLLLLLIGSILGCIIPVIFQSKRSDEISHSGHLGGLIFGMVFYDIIIMNRRPFIDSFFNTFHKRHHKF